jgi:uncharacterized delta-60 repeat protein
MIASRKALIVVAAFVLMAIGLPWGGNVPPAFAQTIQVTSATPPTGDQGTIGLPVTIKGNGFKKGAKAKFLRHDNQLPDGITVTATKYVSSTQLVATIDIAAGAPVLTSFDIEVANADGRTGKGTELFKVTVKIDPCTQPDPVLTPSPYVSDVPGYPGYLDGNFGSAGKVVGPRFMSTYVFDGGASIAIDHLDRVIVVGQRNFPCTANQSSTEMTAARYLPDGSADPEFGESGFVTIPFGGQGIGISVVVQADNKIVVAGGAVPKRGSNIPMVVRLNENGSLDATFGSGGIAWVSQFGNGQFTSVTLQSDGKIVTAGSVSSGNAKVVTRLNTNGTPDMTFHGSGYFLWLGSVAGINAVAIQAVGADERIIVAGCTWDNLNHSVGTVWRFTGAGELDTSFGGGTGIVRTSFHVEDGRRYYSSFKDVKIDASTNGIVAVGHQEVFLTSDISTFQWRHVALVRYDADGDLDMSFGGTGVVWAPSAFDADSARRLAIQADGRILVGGDSNPNNRGGLPLALWRFAPNGTSDDTFRGSGRVLDPITSSAQVGYLTGLALHMDGRIVWGGHIGIQGDPMIYYPFLARFWQ